MKAENSTMATTASVILPTILSEHLVQTNPRLAANPLLHMEQSERFKTKAVAEWGP